MNFSKFTETYSITLFDHWLSREEFEEKNYSRVSMEEQTARFQRRFTFFKDLILEGAHILKHFEDESREIERLDLKSEDELDVILNKSFEREEIVHFYIKKLNVIISPWYIEDDLDLAIFSSETDMHKLKNVLEGYKLFLLKPLT